MWNASGENQENLPKDWVKEKVREGEALRTPDFRLEKQEVLLSERENVCRKN